MSNIRNFDLKVLNWIVDFAVLGATFFVSCMLFSVASGSYLFAQLVVYSTILLISVHLCKHVMASRNTSIGEASRQIFGNGVGILVGTGIMLLFEQLISANNNIFVAILFSSIMAFFILGTLTPIVNKSTIVHKKSTSF